MCLAVGVCMCGRTAMRIYTERAIKRASSLNFILLKFWVKFYVVMGVLVCCCGCEREQQVLTSEGRLLGSGRL